MKKLILPIILCGSLFVSAQEKNKASDSLSTQGIDEVTVTGSRNKKRTAIDTPVPVDVIDVKVIPSVDLYIPLPIKDVLPLAAPVPTPRPSPVPT